MKTRTAVLLAAAAAAIGSAVATAAAIDRADARRERTLDDASERSDKTLRAACYAFFSNPDFHGDWDRFAAAVHELSPGAPLPAASRPRLTVLPGRPTA